ncbi:Cytidylate kinase [Desulfurobacterium pacificum]|uniref:Cytidylate kinase n=1 Tax=Desulfurobacterium pacificum TaxID=240166 RepID=A0ABY1N930_9BACT|nr:cytidylate kinase-like family protein [Desulfurobacterium pacificum]SMP03753.1 Cytidylate kinase [Desulfurobacterium pacificum]
MRRIDDALDLLYEDEELALCCDDVLPKIEEFLIKLDNILPTWADNDFFVEIIDKIRKELLGNPDYRQKLLEGKMGVVTVTFELGSSGLEIAKKIAERLGYRFVYSEILSDVASRLGVPERKIEDFDEFKYVPSKLSFFDFFQLDKSFIDFGAIFGEKTKEITFEQFREALAKSVTAFAVSNNVVIVGHAAACILKEYPNSLHIKVEAPFADRVKVYAEKEGIPYPEAEKRLKKIDEKEKEFYKDICGEDVTAIDMFHLKLNTSKLPVDTCVEISLKAFDLVVEE